MVKCDVLERKFDIDAYVVYKILQEKLEDISNFKQQIVDKN